MATIGPASASPKVIAELVDEGVDLFRINLSHCTREVGKPCPSYLGRLQFLTGSSGFFLSDTQFAREVIETVREYLRSTNSLAEVGIWIDINGPKVRSGPLRDGKPVFLKAGDDFYVVNDENTLGDETKVATTYTKKLLEIGDKIGEQIAVDKDPRTTLVAETFCAFLVIDDGMISLTVHERVPDGVRCSVDNNGSLLESGSGIFDTC